MRRDGLHAVDARCKAGILTRSDLPPIPPTPTRGPRGPRHRRRSLASPRRRDWPWDHRYPRATRRGRSAPPDRSASPGDRSGHRRRRRRPGAVPAHRRATGTPLPQGAAGTPRPTSGEHHRGRAPSWPRTSGTEPPARPASATPGRQAPRDAPGPGDQRGSGHWARPRSKRRRTASCRAHFCRRSAMAAARCG